jgi:type I restriction enzyme M protein
MHHLSSEENMGRKMNGKATTPTAEQTLTPLRKNGKIWSHIRKQWLDETPEESVRQEYLKVLVEEYGFSLDQIEEEVSVTGRGSGDARADFLIWRTPEDKRDNKHAFIVVECKSDNVTIDREVYRQGMNYAQYEQARFFVTHNNRETKYWKVDLARRAPNFDEIENIPHADASDKEVDDLISKLKVFKEDEFADLLHQCHNVIRNREKKDPAAAFDEIAKILFVKVYVERELRSKRRRKNIFTAEFLEEQLGDDPLNDLFEKTKRFYKDDQIFDDEVINLKPATGKEIVRMLERYNLSETSEDIKGIAFERFLGRTFRGEIGQFFTPRTIVEFMIRMVDPKEGEVICDPASGSGGFLIRFFEIVRQQILADADCQYQAFKASLEGKKLSEAKKAELLRARYEEIQATIDQSNEDSRLWKLANRCIFGMDANDRMARTSKMNMIMHGDGHGGVHHHDGFINVNGIFDGRFDLVLTNPPFGANVESGDVVLESEIEVPKSVYRQCEAEYGDRYTAAYERVRAMKDKPIAGLFELPRPGQSKVKTEILFIERCLNLLHPGGRMGIVLPEGVFNNPSLAYVREFCEDRAFIRAVVSLPQETFYSSGASVKASLLFMDKFTGPEQADYDAKKKQARADVDTKHAPEIEAETQRLMAEIASAKADLQGARRAKDKKTEAEARARVKAAQKELSDYLKAMEEQKTVESRALLKERFAYPVFMYEAEKVGLTATGEADQNELYPNDNQPPGLEKTCVELYQQFRKEAAPFFLNGSGG